MSETRFHVGGEPLVLTVAESDGRLRIDMGEQTLAVDAFEIDERYVTLFLDGRVVRLLYARNGGHLLVSAGGETYEFVPAAEAEDAEREAGAFVAEIISPMPGKVLAVEVAAGDEVEADQPLVRLEAMKMEQTVRAPSRARVAEVLVAADEMVGPGATLVRLEEIGEDAPVA